MLILNTRRIYKKLKHGSTKYDEEIHCPMILETMMTKGRLSAFLVEAMIAESTFYQWVYKYPIFAESYALGKALAKENWEIEGENLRNETHAPGVISNRFEHWKIAGWSRFGIGKSSRIRLNIDYRANPSQHYAQLIAQAAEGDFTASEIKQLMEAINVGLNTHQVFQLQKEIDELKSDLVTMASNSNGNYISSN